MSSLYSTPKSYQAICSNIERYLYKLFCNWIKLSNKMYNWYDYRIFGVQCLKQNVYPKSQLVNSHEKSVCFIKAAITATRTSLRERIHKATISWGSLTPRISNVDDV